MGGLVLPGSGGGYTNPIATPVADFNFKQSLLYGPQLSVVNASGGYIDDSTGNWSFVGPNTLRRSDKGLLIEGAQTNSIRNNSMQGAAVGGATATNWSTGQQVTGLGTENGIDYIDLRFTGTTGGNFRISPESAGITVTAGSSQLFTGSVFLKLIAGDLSAFGGNIALRLVDLIPATLQTTTNVQPNNTASLGKQRFSVTRTLDSATTNFRFDIYNPINATGAYDFTLRIGWPQLEQWNTSVTTVGGASSPIRTTGTAATRAADVVTGTLGVGLSALTIAAVYQPLIAPNTQQQNILRIGSASDRVELRCMNGANLQTGVIVGGNSAGSATTTTAANTVGFRHAAATALAVGDAAISLDGAAVSTGSPTNLPSGQTFLTVGGINPLFGYIERLAILPARMVNSELQRLATLSTWGG